MSFTKIEINCETGEEIIAPLSAEELAQREKDILEAKKPIPELTPAEKLFARTGLTVEEYKALGL